MPLSVSEFVRRWKLNVLSERSGSQSHFIDLCEVLGQPHPAAADAVGERFTFEKPVPKTSGGKGFADVWLRDHFAWEYKGKHKDLKAAYKQINDYREELGNPPLLVICDMDRFEVHTNFTSTSKRVYAFDLSDLERNVVTVNCPLPPLTVLRSLFENTDALRPNRTDAFVTQEAAKVFARLAERLEIEKRSLTDTPIHTKEEIAHFLMRLLFCLFADSIGLLPKHLFRNLVQSDDRFLPKRFIRKLRSLFDAMSNADRDFDTFGEHTIKYFNGGLFDSSSIIELDTADLAILHEATRYNWAYVAPEIFGTLFERSLNAERRSLIGAHYTSAEDILLLIEPVLMRPLERRWAEVQSNILTVLGIDPPSSFVIPEGNLRSSQDADDPDHNPPPLSANGSATSQPRPQAWDTPTEQDPGLKARSKISPQANSQSLLRSNPEAERILSAWIDELTSVRVLDPACGSGNFLYLALRRMLDLWLEAQKFAAKHDISMVLPKMVSPSQLYGIETEFYAHELASIVVWIGFLQWKFEHAIHDDREPILQKLNNIEHADAIMRYQKADEFPEETVGEPYEPLWPKADYIIGNPPFLGGKLLRRELGDKYVDDLFSIYKGQVKAESDLVVYWFHKAFLEVGSGRAKSAGLLATQAIRGGANRAVLQQIAKSTPIFWAWSDRKWMLQGAAVHVSMIAFRRPQELRWPGKEFIGPNGPLEPGKRPSHISWPDEDEPYLLDGEPVDFINPDLTTGSNTASALSLTENEGLCFMGTTKVGAFDIDAKTAQRMISAPLNPNGRPNSDVVRPWVNATDITRRSRGMFIIDFGTDMPETGAALYESPFEYIKHHVKPVRQNNKRETYAMNWWIHGEARGELRKAIASLSRFILTPSVSKHRLFVWEPVTTIPDHANFAFAREDDYFFGVLHSSTHELWARAQGTQLREVESGFRYTPNSTFDTFPFPYPPGTEPSESDSPIVKAIADAARELVRLRDAWLNPPNASEADLKERTLTKLYNARYEWLANAHRTLDRAVFAAYGWPYEVDGKPLSDQEILSRLLTLNHERAAAQAK
jgi:type II restriction/modification system DNA methylase subunit YeeA